jgi:hypothetical protein
LNAFGITGCFALFRRVVFQFLLFVHLWLQSAPVLFVPALVSLFQVLHPNAEKEINYPYAIIIYQK